VSLAELDLELDDIVAPRRNPSVVVWTRAAEPTRSAVLDTGLDVAGRVIALLALVALFPILVLVCLAIRIESPGSPLYRQVRVGQNGRTFVMWKLRTMRSDAERRLVELRHLNEHDGVLFKIRRDPRITRVGRWLRRLSVDELPQLLNVVRGEMALVGPRPCLPEEADQYDAWMRRRLDVKPGITGLWQVSGRSDLTWDESIALDLRYVTERSARFDLKIIARTFSAVATGRGAY